MTGPGIGRIGVDGSAGGATGAALAALARRAAPDLQLAVGELIDRGWDNLVLRARAAEGTEWIFRFPRRPEVVVDVEREGRLLPLLGWRLPVAVPDWRVHALIDGQVVIGYPALPGAPAGIEPRGDGDFVMTISIPPPAVYAASLGAALVALHRIPAVDLATTLGAPDPPGIDRALWSARLDRAVSAVHLPEEAVARWRRCLGDDSLWRYQPVLVHGDVHPEHTMVDESGRLTGIIDWTDAGFGDPAQDFIDPRHAFGPEFADDLLRAYAGAGGPADATFMGRVIMRQSFGALTALLFGLDQGEHAISDRAIARIAAWTE